MRVRRVFRWLSLATALFVGLIIQGPYHLPLTVDDWREQQANALEALVPPGETTAQQIIPPDVSPTAVPQPRAPGTPELQITPTQPDDGAMAVDCDIVMSGVQPSCHFDVGQQFTIQVHVAAAPEDGYAGFQAKASWLGEILEYVPTDEPGAEVLWPLCSIPLRHDNQPTDPSVVFGCTAFPIPTVGSTFTGAVLQLVIRCRLDGASSIALISRGSGDELGTAFFQSDGASLSPALVSTTVTCGTGPQVTPTPPLLDTPDPSETPVPTVVPPDTDRPVAPGTAVEKDIPAAGGRIDSADGKVSIEFSDEAIDEPLRVRITHEAMEQLAAVPDHHMLSAWRFDAYAIDRDFAKVEEFSANVHITVQYSEPELRGFDPDTLQLWTFNEETNAWDTLPSEHTPGSGTVSVDVDHFSIDAGTADPAVSSPSFLRSFQTDLQTGASQVSYPIEVPPGPGGLQPSLALSYDSNRVNEMKSKDAQGSWVGVGWDLSVGSVRRVWADVPGSQSRRSRYYLELNGIADEIIPTGDSTFPYRLRHEQFWRIQREPAAPGYSCNPTETPIDDDRCGWIVTDKLGHVYRLGTGANNDFKRWYTYYWSNPAGWADYYYRWDLVSVTDAHGNEIDYHYTPVTYLDQPACCGTRTYVLASYLSSISYDDNKITVEFASNSDYNCPPSQYAPAVCLRQDSPRDIAGGGGTCHYAPKVLETKHLDTITVKVNNQTARSYALQYDNTGYSAPDCNNYSAGSLLLRYFTPKGKEGSFLYTSEFQYTNYSFRRNSTAYSRKFLTVAKTGFAGGQATFSYCEAQVDYCGSSASASSNWTRVIVNNKTLDFDGPSGQTNQPNQATFYDYSVEYGPEYYIPLNAQGGSDPENGEYRGFRQVRELPGDSVLIVHNYNTTSGAAGSHEPTEVKTGLETDRTTYSMAPYQWEPWERIDNTWAIDAHGCWPLPTCSDSIQLTQVTHSLYHHQGPPFQSSNAIVTQYDYDSRDNQIREHQLGEYATSGDERVIYHPYFTPSTGGSTWIHVPRFEEVQDTQGYVLSSTKFFYDGSDSTSTQPTVGNLTGVGRWFGTTNVYYQYDSRGNRTKESVPTDIPVEQEGSASIPSGVTFTRWEYNYTVPATPPCDPTLEVYPSRVTDPLGHETTICWDETLGVPIRRTDANGHISNTIYDEFGRVQQTSDNSSGGLALLSFYVYLWGESIPRTLVYDAFTWTSHCFDGFGREFQTRRPYKAGTPNKDSVVEKGFDSRGLVAFDAPAYQADDTLGGFDYAGACTALGQYTANKTTHAYNPLSQVKTKTETWGSPTRVQNEDYDGLTVTITDMERHRVSRTHDAFGRLSSTVEFSGIEPNWSAYATTAYSYDLLDNLRFATDAQGNKTEMRYDGLSRKTDMFDPDMGHWKYNYDERGNLTDQTDARGQLVSMTYDALSRLIKKCYGISSNSCQSATTFVNQANGVVAATFQYDAYATGGGSPGNCGQDSTTAVGHVVKMVSSTVGEAQDATAYWCYDVKGREITKRRTIDGTNYDIVRTYDDADRPAQTIYIPNTANPSSVENEWVQTTYDPINGQPSGLRRDTPNQSIVDYALEATYKPPFWLDDVDLGNGFHTDSDYDPHGWLTQIFTTRPGLSNLQSLQYSYDNVGNVKTINGQPDEGLTTFHYDEFNRLIGTGATPGVYSVTYEYDRIGNMTRIKEAGNDWHLTYGTGRRPHAVHLVDSATPATGGSIVRAYGFDSNGNVTGLADTSAEAQVADSDSDGCGNAKERGPTVASCGLRDPAYYWDFFDTPNGGVPFPTPQRDCTINTNDLYRVSARYAQVGDASSDPALPAPTSGYHSSYDRSSVTPTPTPPGLRPANGAIGLSEIYQISGPGQMFSSNGGCPSAFPETFAYDAENRMVTHVEGTATTTYVYDGKGSLIKRKVVSDLGTVTTYYMDNLYERTSTGTTTKFYWFNGRRIATDKSSTRYYVFGDNVGSNSKTVRASDNLVVSNVRYYPYGRTRSFTVGALPSDKFFAGHQMETAPPEDDLYFMQARFYDPFIGRFLQPDSIVPDLGNSQSMNRYSYVYNNPLTYTDPTGHAPQCADINGAHVCALPTFSNAWPGDSWAAFHKSNDRRGLIQGLTDFGLGTLPIIGEGCDLFGGFTSRTCSWQHLSRKDQAITFGAFFAPFVGGRVIRWVGDKGDEAIDALRAARRGIQIEREVLTAAGLEKNTRRIRSVTGTTSYRVPDVLDLDSGVLGEIKSGKYVEYTSQLRDYHLWTRENGYTFQLWVNEEAQLAPNLQSAVDRGEIVRLNIDHY